MTPVLPCFQQESWKLGIVLNDQSLAERVTGGVRKFNLTKLQTSTQSQLRDSCDSLEGSTPPYVQLDLVQNDAHNLQFLDNLEAETRHPYHGSRPKVVALDESNLAIIVCEVMRGAVKRFGGRSDADIYGVYR